MVELPPAGTLVGIAKREMRGTPTAALKTPADISALAETPNSVRLLRAPSRSTGTPGKFPGPAGNIRPVSHDIVDTSRREPRQWPPQEEIIAGLAEIIEEVTGIEPSEVTVDKSFVDDLDIDSLSMVEIAVQTEDKYGVKIPDEDLAGLRTVGDAVNYIQKLEAEGVQATNDNE